MIQVSKYVNCPLCGGVEFEVDFEEKGNVYCLGCDHDFEYPKTVIVGDMPFQTLCGLFGYCTSCLWLNICVGIFPEVKKDHYDPTKGKGEFVFLIDTRHVKKKKNVLVGKCVGCAFFGVSPLSCDGCRNYLKGGEIYD